MFAGYYMEFESHGDYFVQAPGLDYPAVVLAGPTGDPNSFVTLAPGYFDSETDAFELDSLGIFGEMYWDLTDTVKLTVGLRYTEDEKYVRDRQVFLNVPVLVDVPTGTTSFLGSDGSVTPVTTIDELINAAAAVGDYDADVNTPGGQAYREDDIKFDEFTGRIVLDWTPDLEATDETLFYFSFSRGYKGGGINPPIDTALFPNTPESFNPEEIDAYEIGTKNTFWDRRAQLNASVFYYDYSGLQIGKIINRTSLNENTDAEIFGVEVEVLVQPTENWQFNGQFSYLDTELKATSTIDPRDPTQGRQDVTLIKDFGYRGKLRGRAQRPGAFLTECGGCCGIWWCLHPNRSRHWRWVGHSEHPERHRFRILIVWCGGGDSARLRLRLPRQCGNRPQGQ